MMEVFKNCFNFSARWTRSQFWPYTIVLCVILCILFGISTALAKDNPGLASIISLLTIPLSFANIAPTCGRLRDAGFSPFLILLNLIPGGSLVVFVFLLLPTKN